MILPRRRKRLGSGIERGPRRVYPTHRAFVRGHHCSIRGCQGGPIEFAHLRTAANSGMGLKPTDAFGISLCRAHHRQGHERGHETLAAENGMTLEQLHAIAAEFARRTPDKALRAAMRLGAELAREGADAV
ncbi:MAG TPA: hypothetical protein VFA12_20620 [Stellaceae bacterium]|nr:hypothetical protein [Stellaceae bacterium]